MKHIIKGTLKPLLEPKDVETISKLIIVAESQILRVIDFDFGLQLPYPFLSYYCEALYPGMLS